MTDTENTGKVDVLKMLREAQGDAAEVGKAQAHLRGQLDQAIADGIFDQNPVLAKLKTMLDEVRTVADEAALLGDVLPAPYGMILKKTAHWIGVADDAFKVMK